MGRPRLRDDEAVARADPAPLALAGGELEDGAGSATAGRSPGLQVRRRVHDNEVVVDEHGVDGEAHEERVNRRRRPEEKALTMRKARSSEQASHACYRISGEGAPFADRLPVFLLEPV